MAGFQKNTVVEARSREIRPFMGDMHIHKQRQMYTTRNLYRAGPYVAPVPHRRSSAHAYEALARSGPVTRKLVRGKKWPAQSNFLPAKYGPPLRKVVQKSAAVGK